MNQLTGEVEKEKLEFTVMDSQQLTELRIFAKPFKICLDSVIQKMLSTIIVILRLYTLQPYSDQDFQHTFRELRSYRNPRKYRANTTNGQHTRKFDVSQYDIRSTVINRFIDIALSQRLSQSEITLLINDELLNLIIKMKCSVENPYTILTQLKRCRCIICCS